MAMKGYSTFSNAPASDGLVLYLGQSMGGFLLLCKEAVDVFYCPSTNRLGCLETHSWPLFFGLIRLGVVIPVRDLSMPQIDRYFIGMLDIV